MKRAKKEPGTTTMVWWENIPKELDDFLKKQFEEAEEREKKRSEKRAKAKKKTTQGLVPPEGASK